MEATTTVPLDQVLSQIGLGWFHVRLWWICGLGFSAAAVEVVLMAFVFPELREAPWSLNEYQLGTLATVIGCGSIFGEVIFGYLADKYGRRNIFCLTVVFVVVFGVASSFAPSIYWLAALRLCVGFGYGGNIAIDFTMYSEFLPTQGRGKMLFLLTGFWPLGQIFTSLLAWLLIPWVGWRAFVAACAIPSLITAFARPLIPESPRWLLTHGRVDEATEICREMAAMNGKTPNDVGLGSTVRVCLDNENSTLESSFETSRPSSASLPSLRLVSLQQFFNSGLLRTTVGLLVVVASLNYIGYGTNTLMPSFLEMKGIPRANVYRSMVLNGLAQIPGVLLAAYCATNFGRLPPLRISIFLTGFALFGFAIAQQQGHVVACTMLASCFLESAWALYHVYVPEVFPTECRALATGFLASAGSVVAIAGPLVSAALMTSKTPLHVIFAFSSVAVFAGCCACGLLHIETMDRDLLDVSHPVAAAKRPKAKV